MKEKKCKIGRHRAAEARASRFVWLEKPVDTDYEAAKIQTRQSAREPNGEVIRRRLAEASVNNALKRNGFLTRPVYMVTGLNIASYLTRTKAPREKVCRALWGRRGGDRQKY
jgi:hypothetical protein